MFFVWFCSCHLFYPPCLEAHNKHNRAIEFPDVPGYLTLVCDLHMHTIFSDGSVAPNIRVTEAKKDHVDVIATTEHLEYQSWKDDIPNPDRNRSFQIATDFAKEDEALIQDYELRIKRMPLKVLKKHGFVKYENGLLPVSILNFLFFKAENILTTASPTISSLYE